MSFSTNVVDDLHESVNLQRSAADKSAVDVRLAKDFLRIGTLDASAVLNTNDVGNFLAITFGNPRANVGVNFLRLIGRGDFAGADRPNRFIRDNALLHIFSGDAGEGAVELTTVDFIRDARFTFFKEFADADDRDEAEL